MKKILLVEDDYLDVKSVKRAFGKLNIEHEIVVAHNGVDALAILNGNAEGGVKLVPDVILLDLNMPKMNGLEFLRIIRNYYSLKNISVFVTTTSSEEYDRVSAKGIGISGYILKPLDFEAKKKDDLNESTAVLKEILLKN